MNTVPAHVRVGLFDRTTRVFELISVTPKGVAGKARSENPTVSDDDRYVAFTSAANDLQSRDAEVERVGIEPT